MEKVLIDLFVPSLGEHFDVLIPTFLPVKEVVSLLSKSLKDVSEYNFSPQGDELICSIDQNIILDQNYTFSDYNILNGEHIIIC